MLYDDRLGTVLRLNATGPAVLRIQFRQLIDLLGSYPANASSQQLEEAYFRLGALSHSIPAEERTQAINDAGLRLRSPRLVAALANCEPQVASAALRSAKLTSAQWLDLVPSISPAPRIHLNQRDDLPAEVQALLSRLGVVRPALPPAQSESSEAASSPSSPIPDNAQAVARKSQTGIKEIVERIEAYRRSREGLLVDTSESPSLPLGDVQITPTPDIPSAFDFTTDAEFRINWSAPEVSPMVNGVRLGEIVKQADCVALMHRQQPLRGQPLELEGAIPIAGPWLLDAAPWFDHSTGRFLGYRGRMRRMAASLHKSGSDSSSQSDRIRQMLHELRTPVSAIQGFAEVIQQQLFGPAPHEYRAIAAEIAADAARILAAFEELDRLAKLASGALELEAGKTDLAALAEAAISQLSGHSASQGTSFSLRIRGETPFVGLAKIEAERILWRLLAIMASVSAAGEIVKLNLEPDGTGLRLDLTLPAPLAAMDGDAIFTPAADAIPQTLTVGLFGIGFTLRLARTEARAAGGDLLRNGSLLTLILPGLSEQSSDPVSNQTS